MSGAGIKTVAACIRDSFAEGLDEGVSMHIARRIAALPDEAAGVSEDRVDTVWSLLVEAGDESLRYTAEKIVAALSPQTLPAPGEVERIDAEVIAEFAFLYRAYGIEDDAKLAPDALELKRKVLAAVAPTLATGMAAGVPTMPQCDNRALWSDDEPSGYLESDRDWSERNSDVVTWLIENHAAIRLTTVAAANDEGVVHIAEMAAQIVTDGYRCRTCKAVFVNNGDALLGGHPDNGCGYPNWDKLEEDAQAAAIRLLSQGSGK